MRNAGSEEASCTLRYAAALRKIPADAVAFRCRVAMDRLRNGAPEPNAFLRAARDRSLQRGSRTLLRLSEAGQNLVIDYPAWPGLLMIGLGVALAVHLARRFEWNRQTFGVTAATAVLLYGGLYFLTSKVTLTSDGGRAYALPGLSQSIQWSHVVSVATEERHGRGTSTWIVIYTATGAGLEIKVTGLSGADEHRLRKYIAARVNK